MKKIISFVLFGTEGRYCGNMAYNLIANSSIYPDFHLRFYVHKNSMETKGFKLLKTVADKIPTVELETIDTDYQGTMLTTMRMKPLWEEEVEFLFCRDLDSIINSLERMSVEYFMKSGKGIHGIRSYVLHTVPFLAGLCGFKRSVIIDKIKKIAPTFEDYIKWGMEKVDYCKKGWIWGCDQALLRDFFSSLGLYNKALDCPQFTAPLTIAGYNPTMAPMSRYEKIKIVNCDMKVLEYSNSISKGFTGSPLLANTDQVYHLMEISNSPVNDAVKEFYNV